MDPLEDSQATMSIVVSASNDAMKSLGNKLRSLLRQEYIKVQGVRGDIQYICDEIDSMQVFLKRTTGDKGERQQDWMKQVRELAYDIEDYVDDLSSEPRRSRKLLSLWRAWYLLTTINTRQTMAKDIRNFKIQVQQIKERQISYGVEILEKGGSQVAANAFTICLAPPATAKLMRTRAPVGMDDAIKELEPWFAEGKQITDQLRYVAIYGFGGIGKTMLAKTLYRKFGDEFDCRASVTVSLNFDFPTVLKDLLNQIYEQQTSASNNYLDGIQELEVRSLVKKIADQLKGMRYDFGSARFFLFLHIAYCCDSSWYFFLEYALWHRHE